MTCKWLGSPPIISHKVRPFGRGSLTPFRGLRIAMVINHLLNGMILQVGAPCPSIYYDFRGQPLEENPLQNDGIINPIIHP